jgi:uncharacterized protein YdhG (YjbR/CyaY superfamily)
MLADQPKAKTVDEYIAGFSGEDHKRLNELRALFKQKMPKAIEDISYLMPAYRAKAGQRAIAFFAGAKDSVCTYALHFDSSPELLKQAQPYITTKSTMRFPNDKPLPLDVISALLEEKATQYDLR